MIDEGLFDVCRGIFPGRIRIQKGGDKRTSEWIDTIFGPAN